MPDHDQKFKEMLRVFIREFLRLFFPWMLRRLVLEDLSWQPQELFSNPPGGLVHRLDMLARIPDSLGKAGREERLLNLEVESATSLGEARRKIGLYYPVIRAWHARPVTLIGVYINMALDGLGWDELTEVDEVATEPTEEQLTQEKPPKEEEPAAEQAEEEVEGEEVYRVRWRYVALRGLDAERYLQGDNWLGVALSSLMKIAADRRAWLRAEILRRLATECQENAYRKLLLVNCVETYLPLDGDQALAFQRLLDQDPRYQEAKAMLLSAHERIELHGERKQARAILLLLGSQSCGEPDESTKGAINQLEDLSQLHRMIARAHQAKSWADLLAIK